jgi:hypothetical protein
VPISVRDAAIPKRAKDLVVQATIVSGPRPQCPVPKELANQISKPLSAHQKMIFVDLNKKAKRDVAQVSIANTTLAED